MGTGGLDALAELRARDIANGIDPTTIPRMPEPTPPPLAQPFRIPPFDSSSFVEPVRAVTPPLVAEDTTRVPARPTPRLNKVKAWQAELMRPDPGHAA